MNRRIMATLMGLGVTVLTVVAPTAAQADPVSLTCTATQQITYSPGMHLYTQTITTSGSLTYACVGDVQSGTTGFTLTEDRNCLTLSAPDLDYLVTWNDNTTSQIHVHATVVIADGQTVVTKTGTVTSGRFAGATTTEVLTGPVADVLACLSPSGLTSDTEYGTLEIISA